MVGILQNQAVLELDVRKANCLISQYDDGMKSCKQVLAKWRKVERMRPCGDKLAVLVSLFAFVPKKRDGARADDSSSGSRGTGSNGRGNLERIRVTLLIKNYERYKGKAFFFGERSLTISQSEMANLYPYIRSLLAKHHDLTDIQTNSVEEDEFDISDSDTEIGDIDDEAAQIEEEEEGRKKKKDRKDRRKDRKGKKESKRSRDSSTDSDSDSDSSEKSRSRKKVKRARKTKVLSAGDSESD